MRVDGGVLLVGLAQGLVGLLGLLLEQLETPLEGLVLGVVLGAVAGGLLGLPELDLELLDLRLEHLVAVGEGGDLLLLGQVLLLQGLDLVLELLDLGLGLVRLEAEGVHFLRGAMSSARCHGDVPEGPGGEGRGEGGRSSQHRQQASWSYPAIRTHLLDLIHDCGRW